MSAAIPNDPTERLWTPGLFRRLSDSLFGYDFFISYTWSDGRIYAKALAHRLEADGFECFLDSDDYSKGDNWKRVGAWTLRRTSRLVLVGSPNVHSSKPVLRELQIFSRFDRQIIPISFDGTLDPSKTESPLFDFLDADGLRIDEREGRLEIGPTAPTVDDLRNTFNLMRQSQKRVRWLTITACVLMLLAIFSSVAAWFAYDRSVLAEKATRVSNANLYANYSRDVVSDAPQLGVLLAAESVLSTYREAEDIVEPARDALTNALSNCGGQALPALPVEVVDCVMNSTGDVFTIANPAGDLFRMYADHTDPPGKIGKIGGAVRLFLINNDQELLVLDASGRLHVLPVASSSIQGTESVELTDSSGKPIVVPMDLEDESRCSVSNCRGWIALSDSSKLVAINLSAPVKASLHELPLPGKDAGIGARDLNFLADSNKLVARYENALWVWNLEDPNEAPVTFWNRMVSTLSLALLCRVTLPASISPEGDQVAEEPLSTTDWLALRVLRLVRAPLSSWVPEVKVRLPVL